MKIKRRRQIKKVSPHKKHRKWQVQEAKAKFSELIKETVSSGYQTITKNGEAVAYLVSAEEFELYLKPKKTLLEVFDECPYPDLDLHIQRSADAIREIDL